MARSEHKSEIAAAPFAERRTKGRLVSLSAEIVAEPVPSPAHALQQLLVDRTTDGFVADPILRRRALAKFVGAFLLLWGGSATALTLMMMAAR